MRIVFRLRSASAIPKLAPVAQPMEPHSIWMWTCTSSGSVSGGTPKLELPLSKTTERARNIAQGSNAGVPDFSKLVADHRAYFLSGVTRSAEWRESQLIALRSMLKDHAEDFYAALWSDLRRNRIEADLVDVKCTTSEI